MKSNSFNKTLSNSSEFKIILFLASLLFSITLGYFFGRYVLKNTYAKSIMYSSDIPTELRVNGLRENYNAKINNDKVSFSWKYNGANGTTQKKYKIVIYDKNQTDTPEIYNSGYVSSNKNTGITLENLNLSKGKLYYWKVKTVNSKNIESDYSDLQPFVTELNTTYDKWTAIWGEPYGGSSNSNNDYVFIRSQNFSIDQNNLEKVIVSSSGKGTLEDRTSIGNIYFNGEILGIAGPEMKRYQSQFNCFYVSYDITDKISDNNVLSLAGYCRDESRGFLIDVTAYYKDGTKKTYLTSNDNTMWYALDGDSNNAFNYMSGTKHSTEYANSIQYNKFYSIPYENVYSINYPSNFYNVDFVMDNRWQTAVHNTKKSSHTSNNIVLSPYLSENVVGTVVDAKNTYIKNNNVIIEFPEQTFGILRVSINMPNNETIPIYQGYELDSNGEVEYIMNSGFNFNSKWYLKAGLNSFDTVTYKDFKYVQLNCGNLSNVDANYILNNLNIQVIEIRKEFNETSLEFSSSFSSSETYFNNLYQLGKTTYKQTALDIMTDSTERERVPYAADNLINSSLAHMYTNNYTYERYTNEYSLTDAIHTVSSGSWAGDYKLMNIWNIYNEYMISGDTNWLKNRYSNLKKIFTIEIGYEDRNTGFVKSNSTKFATNGSLIDWPRNAVSMPMGYDDGGYYNVPYLCELAYSYKIMANIAKETGNQGDYNSYTNKWNKLKNNIIKYCYNPTTGRMYDSMNKDLTPHSSHVSMHSTAYALAFEIYNSNSMAKTMGENVYNDNKNGFACSIYMTYYVLKGLYNAGLEDYSYNLLKAKDTKYSGYSSFYNVYHNMMTYDGNDNTYNGCLTPEAWDESQKPNMTHSHPWGSTACVMLHEGIFGIKPLSAGELFMEVKLQPGNLSKASISVPISQGVLSVSYNNTSSSINGSITVPSNTKVRLLLPHRNNSDQIKINGKVVSQIKANDFTYIELTSGTYNFSK